MFPLRQDNNSQISFSQNPNHNQDQDQDFIFEDTNFVPDNYNPLLSYDHQPNRNIIDNCTANFQGNTSVTTMTTAATAAATTSGHVAANVEDKKMIRKEIEKERRKQMSSLQSQLRFLLPLEAVKGKRSISDHMNEAVKYIHQLKSNIHDLSVKRDKLKSVSNSSSYGPRDGSGSSSESSNCVIVTPSLEGLEINVWCSGTKHRDEVRLSKVLEAVIGYGYDVVSYTSVKNEERIYHTIHCQAADFAYVDVRALEQKLNDVLLSTGTY